MQNQKRRSTDREEIEFPVERDNNKMPYQCSAHEDRVSKLEKKVEIAEREQILVNSELRTLNKNVEKMTISLADGLECLAELVPQVKIATQWGSIAKTVVMVLIIAICQLFVGYVFHQFTK